MANSIYEYLSKAPLWLLVVVALVLARHLSQVYARYRIRQLGFQAPRRVSYFPFSLDFVVQGVRHAIKHENLAMWNRIMREYGNPKNPWTVEANAAGQRVILTADPDNVKAILATQFSDYGKGKTFNEEWHPFLGDSIFTTDHGQWHQSRQLIRPQFVKDRLSDIHVFEKHFQALLPHLGGQGQKIDIADLFFRFTLDAATDFLLGHSVDSLDNAQTRFSTAFAEVQRIQSLISRMGPINWMMPRKAYNEHLRTLNEFVNPFIERTLRLSPQEIEEKGKSDDGYTFLHALAGHTRDRKVLRDQLIAVLLAGRDTTACTLSWLFYELSNSPATVAKLRAEIKDVVGFSATPTYANLKSMKYLQYTLNETLRLYPVVPYNVRVALKDTTLPSGGGPTGTSPIGVLAGTPVGYSTLVMQRRPDIYPPTSPDFAPPESFSPDRWAKWTPKSWSYIPFNGGPRICIGQQFALTEMGYTVVRILQRVQRVQNLGTGVPKLKAEIVLQPEGGIQVGLWEGEGDGDGEGVGEKSG
ncbi:cytochrome P450 [Pseudovirgaria hyperparasitica]|uniref:Cytochrome P450 n=1 Tax=Pseudovirgaria hyperparasitica TaxID=470096 RepID=A0A6A6VVB5_9PEZI|nr:cytochrome P450 [Pseudovirgaria hyperparasitica]KAF2753809.1 cytochrome P450 [Pseudovirgaria hyperparasitica]